MFENPAHTPDPFARLGHFDRHLALAAMVMKDMQGTISTLGLNGELTKILS